MFCPHCSNKIPDGSNICPLCYANLAGVKPQAPRADAHADGGQAAAKQSAPRPRAKKAAYTKGSRGSRKKSADRTPMIIAFGLIVILIVIIVLIVTSMFGAGDKQTGAQQTAQQATQQPLNTPGSNFVVFGATAEPTARPQITPTPMIEVTATPAPVQAAVYTTLRKGDQGREVVTLQKALADLGYLTGAADGNFGTGTQTAVKKFQEDQGLDADGIAGKMTQEALFALSKVTPIPETTVGPGDIMDLPG